MAESSEEKPDVPPGGALSAYDEEDPEVYRHQPRKLKNLTKRASLPTFDKSVERFVTDAKAEPNKHDVSYFDHQKRESELTKEIEDLKAKLADAEAKVDAARKAAEAKAGETMIVTPLPVGEPPAPKRSWGGILAGFAVGAACMFGVTRLMKSSAPEPIAQRAAPPQPEPAPATAATPTQPVEIKPIDKPDPVADKPVEPMPVVDKPSETKPEPKPQVAKRPIAGGRPATKPAEPKPVDPKPADPKPADPKPADPGLYNPF